MSLSLSYTAYINLPFFTPASPFTFLPTQHLQAVIIFLVHPVNDPFLAHPFHASHPIPHYQRLLTPTHHGYACLFRKAQQHHQFYTFFQCLFAKSPPLAFQLLHLKFHSGTRVRDMRVESCQACRSKRLGLWSHNRRRVDVSGVQLKHLAEIPHLDQNIILLLAILGVQIRLALFPLLVLLLFFELSVEASTVLRRRPFLFGRVFGLCVGMASGKQTEQEQQNDGRCTEDSQCCPQFEHRLIKSQWKKLLMEVNKPDQGILKGMGRLQIEQHINRKYFPKLRNVNQFELTHHHPATTATTCQRFFSAPKPPPYSFSRPKQQSNSSSIQLAHDTNSYFHQKRNNPVSQVAPPKPIKQKEEGVHLGDFPIAQHFRTTNMQRMQKEGQKERAVTFKNRNKVRFDPITGQNRQLGFGFEDYQVNRDNQIRSHNYSQVPVNHHERFDIISGRKMTFQ